MSASLDRLATRVTATLCNLIGVGVCSDPDCVNCYVPSHSTGTSCPDYGLQHGSFLGEEALGSFQALPLSLAELSDLLHDPQVDVCALAQQLNDQAAPRDDNDTAACVHDFAVQVLRILTRPLRSSSVNSASPAPVPSSLIVYALALLERLLAGSIVAHQKAVGSILSAMRAEQQYRLEHGLDNVCVNSDCEDEEEEDAMYGDQSHNPQVHNTPLLNGDHAEECQDASSGSIYEAGELSSGSMASSTVGPCQDDDKSGTRNSSVSSSSYNASKNQKHSAKLPVSPQPSVPLYPLTRLPCRVCKQASVFSLHAGNIKLFFVGALLLGLKFLPECGGDARYDTPQERSYNMAELVAKSNAHPLVIQCAERCIHETLSHQLSVPARELSRMQAKLGLMSL